MTDRFPPLLPQERQPPALPRPPAGLAYLAFVAVLVFLARW